jgi:hypothetical protein
MNTPAMTNPVIKRLVVHVGGYDPMSPQSYHKRFQRELTRFHATWSINTAVSALTQNGHEARWHVATDARDWHTSSDHIMLRWDDVIEADRTRGWLPRLALGTLSFVDFIWHGALWGYLRQAWRYAGFFLYPFLLIALLAASSYFISKNAIALFIPSVAVAGAVSLVSIAVFAALLHWPGRRLFLDHLVDDWIYAGKMLRHGDAVVSQRIEKLAAELAAFGHAETREILIVGHSLGAVHAVELIDRIIALAPDGPPIRFASVGSSILKIGLHRGAKRLKAGMLRMAASPRVVWVEFHALNDVMNFYKCEPMAVLGLTGKPAITRVVRFRAMLEPGYYRRMERNFFRLHCQFVSGNDRRAAYDYFMMLLGPFPMEQLALSPDGALAWIDAEGGLTEAGCAHLSTKG